MEQVFPFFFFGGEVLLMRHFMGCQVDFLPQNEHINLSNLKLIEIVLRSQACNLLWSLRSLTDSFREAAGTTGKDKFIYFS